MSAYYPPAPRPRRRVWPWVLLGVFAAVILLFGASCAALFGAASVVTSGERTLVYEVSGPAKANTITYSTDNLQQEQANNATLPWRKEVTFHGALNASILSAQSASEGGDVIRCKITEGSKELASSESSGPYAVVTCNGS